MTAPLQFFVPNNQGSTINTIKHITVRESARYCKPLMKILKARRAPVQAPGEFLPLSVRSMSVAKYGPCENTGDGGDRACCAQTWPALEATDARRSPRIIATIEPAALSAPSKVSLVLTLRLRDFSFSRSCA